MESKKRYQLKREKKILVYVFDFVLVDQPFKKLGAEGKKFQNFWWEKLMEKTLSGKNKEEKVIESKSNSVLAREIETTKLYGGSFVRASSKSMNHFNKQIFQKESAKEEQKEEEKTTVSDSESSSEEEVKTIVTEKLFLECGKRTLKKYRQKGKHNRLKKQDEEMMKKLKQSEKKRKLSDSDSICDDQSSKKKKKK